MEASDLAGSLATTLLLLVLVVGVSYPVAVWRLRSDHEPTWRALGEPRAFGWPLDASTWRLFAFAVSLRHLRLNDLTLSLACVGFTLGVLAAAAAAVAVALFFLVG
jgi:hypothetical protein